jgi:hypothetical protein
MGIPYKMVVLDSPKNKQSLPDWTLLVMGFHQLGFTINDLIEMLQKVFPISSLKERYGCNAIENAYTTDEDGDIIVPVDNPMFTYLQGVYYDATRIENSLIREQDILAAKEYQTTERLAFQTYTTSETERYEKLRQDDAAAREAERIAEKSADFKRNQKANLLSGFIILILTISINFIVEFIKPMFFDNPNDQISQSIDNASKDLSGAMEKSSFKGQVEIPDGIRITLDSNDMAVVQNREKKSSKATTNTR